MGGNIKSLLVFGVEAVAQWRGYEEPNPRRWRERQGGGCCSRAVFHLCRGAFHVSGITLGAVSTGVGETVTDPPPHQSGGKTDGYCRVITHAVIQW